MAANEAISWGKKKFVYYQENDLWIGWFEEYPDYRTQGTSLDDLKKNLDALYQDIFVHQTVRSADIETCRKENRDLPRSLVKDILEGLMELQCGDKSEYRFG